MTSRKKNLLMESTRVLSNPRRGWYRIFPVTLGKKWDSAVAQTSLAQGDTLVLLEILIPGEDIKRRDIEGLCDVFSFFANKQIEMILRFSYDFEGKGMEKDPSALSVVEQHIKQLLPAVNAFADHIFILQGVFLGSWGEMHSSRFLTSENIQKLEEILKQDLSPKIFRSVRKPLHWRIICPEDSWQQFYQERVGLYNDGMFGSETDLGTFAEYSEILHCRWEEAWSAEKEQQFIKENVRWAPNGGEVICHMNQSAEEILVRLENEGITYLNRDYDAQEMERWKKMDCRRGGVWAGKSLYDYVEAHLGYRFVLRDVKISNRFWRKILCLEIENTGFAIPYEEVFLELWDDSAKEAGCVWRQALQQKEPGKIIKIERKGEIDKNWKIRIRDAKGRCLSFANDVAKEEIPLSLFD
ncbi:MAG: DUF4874 domain-containing protein [Eubacterium sp.]